MRVATWNVNGLRAALDAPHAAFHLGTGQHHPPPAALTLEADVGPQPVDSPGVRPAGVGLLQGQDVVVGVLGIVDVVSGGGFAAVD
mgnify:CR=1 FL=1